MDKDGPATGRWRSGCRLTAHMAAHAPHAAGYATEAVVSAAGLAGHAVAGGAACSIGSFRSAFVPWRFPTGEGVMLGHGWWARGVGT